MGKIIIGSPSDKKGITVSPSKIMFNGNNVKKMMKGDNTIWIDERPLVPTITSNTTPYGEAFADSEWNSQIKAYRVFDGDDTTQWSPSADSAAFGSAYVGYKLNNQSCVKSVFIRSRTNGEGYLRVKGFRIEASNDCTSWDTIFDGTFDDSIAYDSNVYYEQKFSINNNKSYLAYRLVILSGANAVQIEVFTLQFYGS